MSKRIFDIIFSCIGLVLTGWLIAILWIIVTILSNQNGMFAQIRIGQYGKQFTIYKLRSLYKKQNEILIKTGKFLRHSKLDELPQLWNVLIGDMSMVGPRPDVPGYYDRLVAEERKVLQLKPGITGPASIKYRNEEYILAMEEDAEKYNNEIIFPDKIKINLEYQKQQTIWLDLKIIFYTIFGKK